MNLGKRTNTHNDQCKSRTYSLRWIVLLVLRMMIYNVKRDECDVLDMALHCLLLCLLLCLLHTWYVTMQYEYVSLRRSFVTTELESLKNRHGNWLLLDVDG